MRSRVANDRDGDDGATQSGDEVTIGLGFPEVHFAPRRPSAASRQALAS